MQTFIYNDPILSHMAIQISAKSTKQLSSGSSFKVAGKSGTSILNAVPKKGTFVTKPKPTSSIKIGTYKGSSLIVGIGRRSMYSTDTLFAQIPKSVTKTIVFKTTPPTTIKPIKPGIWSTPKVTITPWKAPVVIKKSTKSSSGGSDSSGKWVEPVPNLKGSPLSSIEKMKKGLSNTNKWQVGSK
jgi:hypothetical protein